MKSIKYVFVLNLLRWACMLLKMNISPSTIYISEIFLNFNLNKMSKIYIYIENNKYPQSPSSTPGPFNR